jgi:hypothetical protein
MIFRPSDILKKYDIYVFFFLAKIRGQQVFEDTFSITP